MTVAGIAESGPGRKWIAQYLLTPFALFVVAFIGSSATFSYWMTSRRAAAKEAKPRLVVAADNLSFGTVWARSDFTWTLPITNRTAESLSITRVTASCSCSKVEPATMTLAPGETAELTLRIDLTGAIDGGSKREGTFSLDVHCQIDGGLAPDMRWTVRGIVKSAYRVSPAQLDFGQRLIEGSEFPPMTLVVVPYFNLQGIATSCEPHNADVTVEADDAGSGSYLIKVTPRRGLPVGNCDFRVGLTSDAAPDVPPHYVTVRATVHDDVRVLPEFSHLGIYFEGDSINETLTLESRTGGSFQVTSAQVRTPGFMLSATAHEPGTQRAFKLSGVVESGEDRAIEVVFEIVLSVPENPTKRVVKRWFRYSARHASEKQL